MKFDTEIFQRSRELLRQLANHQYEVTPSGIYFEKTQALIGGTVGHLLNGRDYRLDDNTWTTEGLNYLLDTGFNRSSAATAFYVAPFSGNVTPASTLTAATFTSTCRWRQSSARWPRPRPQRGACSVEADHLCSANRSMSGDERT